MQLLDGYQCLIALEFFPTLWLWEREVQPFGVDGGGAIEVATMRNIKYRPKAPPWLKDLEEMTCQVSWDPATLSHMASNTAGALAGTGAFGLPGPVLQPALPGALASWIINVHQNILIAYPDGSGHIFPGWVRSFKPAAMKEKEFPLAEMKIQPSNLRVQPSSNMPPGTFFTETDITYIPPSLVALVPHAAKLLAARPGDNFTGRDRGGHADIRGVTPIFP